MTKQDLLSKIAPCGLVCYTCAGAKNGAIQHHSRQLSHLLQSFEVFLEKMPDAETRLQKYANFTEVLQLLSHPECEGCRDGHNKFPGCRIAPCIKEKGYDYCFECPSFPCDEADFEPILKTKWLAANQRMKEIGVEAFFVEVKDKPHYG